MKGIWAIPATRNTRTFFRLGAQTVTAWSVLLAEVPLCVLTDPRAACLLSAQFRPFAMTFTNHGFRDSLGAL